MEKEIPFKLIDRIISVIRNNLPAFSNDYIELTRQLYRLENMRLSKIPEKYILQSLLDNNRLILKLVSTLADEELLLELTGRIMALDKE